MHVITLLNEKGGVGKTTLAVHIAAGLAVRGWRVALIDADPQGHATVAMGAKKSPGLYELLVRDAPYKDVMSVIPPEQYLIPGKPSDGRMYLIPSNLETRVIPMMISDAMKMHKRLTELEDTVDIVVFDTSPTPSLLHGSIYFASDHIIYPTKCEYLSFDGLVESLTHSQAAMSTREQQGLNALKIMGIVPTMYRSSTMEHRQNLNMLKKQFGPLVWRPIPQRTIWAEASSRHQPVFALMPDSQAATDIWHLVDHVEEGLKDAD